MGVTFLFLIGLLQFYFVMGQDDCRGFQMYDGDTEVTNFQCSLFTTKLCEHGPSTFPHNLSIGVSVGKPRYFDIKVFQRNFSLPQNHEVYLAPGAIYTWKPPLDTISRANLKGFYLRLLRVGSGKIVCRLIDLQRVDLTASTGFHFVYELFPYNAHMPETYVAYLTSLPPPTDLEFEGGLVEQSVYAIPALQKYSETPVVYPAKWITWINLKLHGSKGTVEVKFGYPAEGSVVKVTRFQVQIISKDRQNQPLYTGRVNRIGSEAEGVYNFTSVPSGSYKVQVKPEDLFFNEIGRCQCWDMLLNTGNSCSVCTTTTTDYFNFTSITDGLTTTPPVIVTTGRPTASESISITPSNLESDSLGASTVVVAVIVPVLLLIVVPVVLGILYKKGIFKRFCGGGKDQNKNRNLNNNRDEKPDYKVHFIDILGNEQGPLVWDAKKPELSRKKVLLLASEDHEHFTQAVENLAGFLQVHCMCDVTFAPQQMPQLRKAANSYCWLSRQIDSADFVVIVTSEAAYQLYLAFRKGNGYTKAALGPEGDLFTPGIQHICAKIANNDDVRNVIMVYFDHTAPTFRLPIAMLSSFLYHLPKHLTGFLHHIHGLDKTKMDLSQVNLPLQGNVEELEGGKEWLDAVQQAGDYEQRNPTWFESKFGKPAELFPTSQTKPDYGKQHSDDSGYIESRNSKELKRRLSSASNNAGDIDDPGMDTGMDNGSFIKDYFSPPSMCTANTAYTIPYPGSDKPPEIDDGSISEEFHRLNQRYEQELQIQNHSVTEKNSPSTGPRYDPSAYGHLHPVHMDGVVINFSQEDEDQDCISVSSAQSV